MSQVITLSQERAAKRQRRKGGGTAASEMDEALAAVNGEFALVLTGGKALVLQEHDDFLGRPVVDFYSLAALHAWMENRRYFDAEEERVASLAKLWMRWPQRRSYEGVAFAPEGAKPKWFNLWRGLAVQPAEPYADPRQHVQHFRLFYDHMYENVCQKDKALTRWVWAWFADLFQHPTGRPGTTLVLRGNRGSGKTKPGQIIGSLLGSHWLLVSQPKHLTGAFNAHMKACLLLQAEEGFWAGDQEAEGALKSLITSDVQMIEPKGVDAFSVRNLVRLMVTSNSDWVVPAAFDERRFAVLDVGDGRKQQRAYFKAMDEQLDNGGRKHLLAWLLAFDMTGIDVGVAPNTAGLTAQKISTMDEPHHWWVERLREGRLLDAHSGWAGEVPSKALYLSYIGTADRIGKKRKLAPEQFGMVLRKLVPDGEDGKPRVKITKVYQAIHGPNGEQIVNSDGSPARRRVNGYRFPPLDVCRALFVAALGAPFDWGEDEGESAEGGAAAVSPAPAGGCQDVGGGVFDDDPFALRD